jgi:hypothetical protein
MLLHPVLANIVDSMPLSIRAVSWFIKLITKQAKLIFCVVARNPPLKACFRFYNYLRIRCNALKEAYRHSRCSSLQRRTHTKFCYYIIEQSAFYTRSPELYSSGAALQEKRKTCRIIEHNER